MIHTLSKQETKEIQKMLHEQFGVEELNGILIKIGEERIFLYQGSLNERDLMEVINTIPIERIGIYFAKVHEDGIRLSVDGTHILKDSIKEGIYEISEEEVENWMQGKELENKTEAKGFAIIKHKTDLLGTGKASQNKITNFIPKNRRLKEKH